jgi:cell division protein FtsA
MVMARPKIHVGLEIGTSKVGFVVSESRPDGGTKNLSFGHSVSRGVRKGEIVDAEAVKQSIREALDKIEAESGHEISEVYLAVSGGHIAGVNVSTSVEIPTPPGQVELVDIEDLHDEARRITLPQDHALIHTMPNQLRLDGRVELNPVGQFGKLLEGDFHIVHGDRNRTQKAIQCVQQLSLGVADIVFSPIAAAHVALSEEQKREGVVLIDLGGGTTDFLLYAHGQLVVSGSIPLGGEHITNDIALVLEMPLQAAEQCKSREGSVYFDSKLETRPKLLREVRGLENREIDCNKLNEVIHWRAREMFGLVKQRLEATGRLSQAKAGLVLTGGGSLLTGIAELAGRTFGLRVIGAPEVPKNGTRPGGSLPQFSTLLGLVRYAQIRELKEQPKKGAMSLGERIVGWLGVS